MRVQKIAKLLLETQTHKDDPLSIPAKKAQLLRNKMEKRVVF